MNRPSDDQLDAALDAARRMQMYDVDPHHLASSLLYLNERHQDLWEVLCEVDRYIRFGLPEAEMARLGKEIQRLREETQAADPESGLRTSAAV